METCRGNTVRRCGLSLQSAAVCDFPSEKAFSYPSIPDGERRNFHITDDALGVGIPGQRYANNIAAICLLKRLATAEEQEVLSRYVGWGGLADCFDERSSKYTELKELLTGEEYSAARESTLTPFYTPPVVIRAMYQVLDNMNFRSGNILEPSCGVGNFLGMLPESMTGSKLYGVELDSVSGRIAQQLYRGCGAAASEDHQCACENCRGVPVKSDKQRSILITIALGLIPVIWLALLMAPYLDGGLPELLANLDKVLESPFAIRWCSDSPRTVLIFSMLYLVGVGILMSDQKNYRRREEYGSAKLGSVAALAAKYGEKRKEFLLFVKTLTMAVAISFQVWIHKRNLNVVVIGGSGSGKTRSYVYENLLNANTSFVILDPKGEIVRMTGSFLEEEGYEIRVLDLIHMEKSHCYNAYMYLRSVDDIQRLATSLFESASAQPVQSSEPFWNDSASIILKALICFQHYVCPVEDQNFDTLMEMLRSAQVREEDESYQSPLDILFERLREKEPDHIAVKFYDDFKIAAGKTAKSILITLLSKLEMFNIPSLAQLTMTDEMDLRSLGQKKTAIFAVVPDSDTSFNFLVSILYEQAFQILYEQADTSPTGRLPVHVHFLMDEFANVAIPKDFEKKLATMRSREISVSIILQSLSQLKALYEKQWEGIIANCDSMLYLGGNDQFTHEYISKSLGKETIDTNSYGKSSGRSGSYSTWMIWKSCVSITLKLGACIILQNRQ